MVTLAEFMKRKGWTDQTLAEKVGKDRSTITKIRLGLTLPSLKGAVEIERVTGVRPASYVQQQAAE